MKKFFFSVITFSVITLFICPISRVNAQGVGVNSSGNAPDQSAILDASATNKGMLIPRLSTAERNTITSPALSLFIFNTTDNCFQVYNGNTSLWENVYCFSGCIAAPSAPVANTATNVQATSFSANWNQVAGAISYYLDVSINNSFNSFLSGYNNLHVGAVTTYNVSGVGCSGTYYYRVRANNACGASAASNIITVSTISCCSNTWTEKAAFGGIQRQGAVGFSIGTKGYIGTGEPGTGGSYKDLWEWDQATNVWTQKADFGGDSRHGAAAFSIGSKGYVGTGFTNSGNQQDFWEWNQATNTWTQKANFGGTIRRYAAGFSIGTKGYFGTGYDGVDKQDFWEWDQATNIWTQKAALTGAARETAVGFSIGTKGYIGTGYNRSTTTYFLDFWEWDQATNTWTQKTNFGGVARSSATGFAIGTKGYIGAGSDNVSNKQDFWEWDQTSNAWTQKTNFGGTARNRPVGFSIGVKGYIGTGVDAITIKQDFWEYCQ